jgi:RNA polymerase sigma-70 factor, ECF subfamily
MPAGRLVVGPDGELRTLEEQDRRLWDATRIAEGRERLGEALTLRPAGAGPYGLQAAIAALHDEAPDVAGTDWLQVVALYDLLARLHPSPVVDLNRAVAVAMRDGPAAGLRALDKVDAAALTGFAPLHAARADLLRRLGRDTESAEHYRAAIDLTTNERERQFLRRRLTELGY